MWVHVLALLWTGARICLNLELSAKGTSCLAADEEELHQLFQMRSTQLANFLVNVGQNVKLVSPEIDKRRDAAPSDPTPERRVGLELPRPLGRPLAFHCGSRRITGQAHLSLLCVFQFVWQIRYL